MEDLFVDPSFEDEALAALMEEAFSETKEETKFDVEAYFDGNIDYWTPLLPLPFFFYASFLWA